MGHVGPIHPVYTVIARCVGRQLRMRSALSGRDEGGICANTFSDLVDVDVGTARRHGVSRPTSTYRFRNWHYSCRFSRGIVAQKNILLTACYWAKMSMEQRLWFYVTRERANFFLFYTIYRAFEIDIIDVWFSAFVFMFSNLLYVIYLF